MLCTYVTAFLGRAAKKEYVKGSRRGEARQEAGGRRQERAKERMEASRTSGCSFLVLAGQVVCLSCLSPLVCCQLLPSPMSTVTPGFPPSLASH
ncbi:hypothetical protein LY76DRAFT_105827 [Colletotrichum caudatum]|nr:hypothetical protein LY76DRAFT_105827 [Colletotrichum caudatum]